MKIYGDNLIKELKQIVESKAKYQKVMLLFDEDVSNVETSEIYEEIKGLCVYNQANIKTLEKEELFNGYRLIIFRCSVDNFLKYGFNRDEFVCVFYPTDNFMLPYFLSQENKIDSNENFLLINKSQIDLNLISSVNLNMFYNYFKNMLSGQNSIVDFYFNKEITQFNVLNCISEMSENSFFVDVDILKKCEIDYKDIIIVDLLLIDAFLLLIESVKNQNLMIVDVYKSAKDNVELIEKFYRLFNNDSFIKLVVLNYNCLYKYCQNIKQKIFELIGFCEIEKSIVEEVMAKIKKYSKNDNDLVCYLYLYNIFGV
ncbi:MAG: hypothetical protein J6Q13_01510 [Clostridia bacterium]|nr:hypothetical protein [Clostridia bacterium]